MSVLMIAVAAKSPNSNLAVVELSMSLKSEPALAEWNK
jgi:hypothetical protein